MVNNILLKKDDECPLNRVIMYRLCTNGSVKSVHYTKYWGVLKSIIEVYGKGDFQICLWVSTVEWSLLAK